jgi:hypothetical protein
MDSLMREKGYFHRRHHGKWHIAEPPYSKALCGIDRLGSGWLWHSIKRSSVCKKCLAILEKQGRVE